MARNIFLKFSKATLKKNQDITLVIILSALVTGILTKEAFKNKVANMHDNLEYYESDSDSESDCGYTSNCGRYNNCSRNSIRRRRCKNRNKHYISKEKYLKSKIKDIQQY